MASARASLEFWFEFGSTYSYPAAMRVGETAARAGVDVLWRPFLLGPIFKAQGWDDSPFNLYAAKGRYMWRDLERICRARGLPLRRPSVFPRNGLLAARVAVSSLDERWLPDFVPAVYRANFVDDLDIADPAVVAACLRALGIEPAPILERAASPEAKAGLRAATEEAARRGIFGAPHFAVGGEAFWGNDRLVEAIAWARHSVSTTPSIRRATGDDAPALSDIAFRSKAHWGYSDAFMEACRNELSIEPDEIDWCPTFVLESGGEPVGFYSLEARSAEKIELNHLFLEPARIGRGEGRALLAHAIRHAQTHGYRRLVIQSDPNAADFYRACGASDIGESPSDSIPGRSLPLLEISLDEPDATGGREHVS